MPSTEAIREKKWERESDARVLAEATVIRNTPVRMKAAQRAAKELAKKAQKDATAMSRVAGSSGNMTPAEIKKEGIVVTKG